MQANAKNCAGFTAERCARWAFRQFTNFGRRFMIKIREGLKCEENKNREN
jgi:hypothetical protein